MIGQYQTLTGEILKVVIFDETNKMVYAENKIGTHKWYHEDEYSTWENTNVDEVAEQVTEEEQESKPETKKAPAKKTKKK